MEPLAIEAIGVVETRSGQIQKTAHIYEHTNAIDVENLIVGIGWCFGRIEVKFV